MKLGPGLRAVVMRELARSKMEYGGMSGYLSKANLVPIGSNASGSFSFEVQDPTLLHRYLAGDFERFCLASFESFHRSRQAGLDFSFLGWRLLESYYASFFAAHALIRSLGASVSMVDSKARRRMRALVEIYGVTGFTMDSGNVSAFASESGGTWKLTIEKAIDGSGVHDGFWRTFCRILQTNAQNAVATGEPDSPDYLAATIHLTDAVLQSGLGTPSWLAQIRNSINYRHEFNVWFPYHKSTDVVFRDIKDKGDAEDLFRLDLSKKKQSLQLFENTNSKIVHILWDIADLFSSISKKSGHFGSRYKRMISVKN